jgi:hypothetical protein
MRMLAIAAGALALTAAGHALADAEAGVPLTPAEAAGAWTLESDGRGLCQITLGQARAKAMSTAFAARASEGCAGALPGAVAGWTPTADGMALVQPNGQTLISFGRWSNSLFVAHRSSGQDLQLQRGGMENP